MISAWLTLSTLGTVRSPTQPPLPPMCCVNEYTSNRWQGVRMWSQNNRGSTTRVLRCVSGIIYATVVSTGIEDVSPQCWALYTNAASNLGGDPSNPTQTPTTGMSTAELSNPHQPPSQPADRNQHFWSSALQTYLRRLVEAEMNRAPGSFGTLAPSPFGSPGWLLLKSASALWMPIWWDESHPLRLRGLEKADNHTASKRESSPGCVFGRETHGALQGQWLPWEVFQSPAAEEESGRGSMLQRHPVAFGVRAEKSGALFSIPVTTYEKNQNCFTLCPLGSPTSISFPPKPAPWHVYGRSPSELCSGIAW